MPFAGRISPGTRLAISGGLALAVAMGIGRFAFTPILPLMMEERGVSLAQGSWLAAANYAGYLAGAWWASRMRRSSGPAALVGLMLIALATAAMALPGFALWMLLRFVAGVIAAVVFVATSVWCLGKLAEQEQGGLGSWVYTGVGGGIVLSGLYCVLADVAGWSSGLAWVHLALLAVVLSMPVAVVLWQLRGRTGQMYRATTGGRRNVPPGTLGLVISYGIMGFGYIVPATFLPVVARSVWQDSVAFGLIWPVFGLVAMASTLLGGVALRWMGRLHMWTCCQALMGLGAVLPGLWLNGYTIVASAVLVGGTFVLVTLLGVQEMRDRVAWNPGAWVGYLTTAFAAGQIAGPALSGLMLANPSHAGDALQVSLLTAGVALCVSAAWLWREARRAPCYAAA